MKIQESTSGDTVELIMPGRIDGEAANQLEIKVLEAMGRDVRAIYINLAQASFLCSAGIRVLLQYHRKMKERGGILQVSHPAAEVAAALELMGFPDLIEQ